MTTYLMNVRSPRALRNSGLRHDDDKEILMEYLRLGGAITKAFIHGQAVLLG